MSNGLDPDETGRLVEACLGPNCFNFGNRRMQWAKR